MSLWVRWPDVGIRTLCTVVGLQNQRGFKTIRFFFAKSLLFRGAGRDKPAKHVDLAGFSKSIFNTLLATLVLN